MHRKFCSICQPRGDEDTTKSQKERLDLPAELIITLLNFKHVERRRESLANYAEDLVDKAKRRGLTNNVTYAVSHADRGSSG